MKLPVHRPIPSTHAFGVDDGPLYRIPVPSSFFGAGHISRALLGHSYQSLKNKAFCSSVSEASSLAVLAAISLVAIMMPSLFYFISIL